MSVYYRDQAKAARRMTALLLFVIGVFLTVALYYVKTRAQSARAEVKQLERQLDSEYVAMTVLRAELAHLESPERLKALATTHLGLAPMRADQNQSIVDIVDAFPLRETEQVHAEPEE